MKVIGFAGTYYTGWEITEEDRPLGNGRTYKVYHYFYCQNLSKDPNVARAKWGTDEIDMDLRGTKSFERSEMPKEEVPIDCFPFGRSKGYKYETETEKYLAWYYNEELNEERKAVVADVLIKNYNWVREDDSLYSPEDYAAHVIWKETLSKTQALIHGEAPIEVTLTSNLNEYGEVMVRGEYEFSIKFHDWKEMYYNGWLYGLPVDNKGKAKRIKNKVICIKKWNILSDYCIEPVEWEIKK